MPRKNIIGPRICEARKKAHVTQMELAGQLQLLGLKIDRSSIAKIETGRRPVSDVEVAAIARVLKVPITWLFEESDDLLESMKNQ